MATRKETHQRKADLHGMLLNAAKDGRMAPGEKLPSVRHLAKQYRLSVNLTCEVIQSLVKEGPLITVPGSGTFVDRPKHGRSGLFLFISPFSVSSPETSESDGPIAAVRVGFEDRVAQLGGISMLLHRDTLKRDLEDTPSAEISGVFEFGHNNFNPFFTGNRIPRVLFSDDRHGADSVDFDNLDGGRQATRHLLSMGHRAVAFLGVHGKLDPPEGFSWSDWSRERERGWLRAMTEAGVDASGLAFRPDHTGHSLFAHQAESARQSAWSLVRRPEISAVVTVNAAAAIGFFEALREAAIPASQWPALVSFDSSASNISELSKMVQNVTAMRLPWEQVGAIAADLLWERSRGKLPASSQHRIVPMKLITRLTCGSSRMRIATPSGAEVFAA